MMSDSSSSSRFSSLMKLKASQVEVGRVTLNYISWFSELMVIVHWKPGGREEFRSFWVWLEEVAKVDERKNSRWKKMEKKMFLNFVMFYGIII